MSDIEEALDFADCAYLSIDGSVVFPEANQKLINTIKTALQDQAEREKGCEYCKGLVHGGNADGSTLKELETRARITQGNFCPICGRNLRKPENHAPENS